MPLERIPVGIISHYPPRINSIRHSPRNNPEFNAENTNYIRPKSNQYATRGAQQKNIVRRGGTETAIVRLSSSSSDPHHHYHHHEEAVPTLAPPTWFPCVCVRTGKLVLRSGVGSYLSNEYPDYNHSDPVIRSEHISWSFAHSQ